MEDIKIISIQQKMVEITVKEFITREVFIRVRYKGRIKPGIKLLERRLVPEKVKIIGYKSQVIDLQEVEAAGWINLDEIEENTVFKIPLKKENGILEFEDTDTVEVHITVENTNKPKTGNDKQD